MAEQRRHGGHGGISLVTLEWSADVTTSASLSKTRAGQRRIRGWSSLCIRRRRTCRSLRRRARKNMPNLEYDRQITALLVIDPYNDFISEGGKFWDRLKRVAEANQCVPNMSRVLNAARETKVH